MARNKDAWESVVAVADGEPIEAAVVGTLYAEEDWQCDAEQPPPFVGKVLIQGDIESALRSFSCTSGFGMYDGRSLTAWTKSWVITLHCYDGACGPVRVPRHPVSGEPDIIGGRA